MALPDFRRQHAQRSPVRRLALGLLAAAWATFAAVESSRAEVEFDGLFSAGGVLQRGMKVPVFGTGDDGDEVIVSIQGQTATTKVKEGRWRVEFEPLEVGGPYVLSLSGTSVQNVKNVHVGDVWVCAGESNMQSPVQSAEGASAASFSRKNRMLHFFSVKRTGAEDPVYKNAAKWSDGLSTTVGAFSAVGYYFGRDIQAATDVPVGLIACNHYSSSAEAWVSSETLLADPVLKHYVDDATGRIVWQTPGRLYNAMVLPISGYAIKGVICYHGESNVDRAGEYKTVFSMLISDWRKAWNRPDLPFLFVQLSGYKPATSKPNESKLAQLREAQAETVKDVPHTAMIVSTDLGDAYNQVPRVKEPVGKRLAFAARNLVYGEKFEYLGPTFKEAVYLDTTVVVSFEHLGDGLLAKDKSKVLGFMVAGENKEFVAAEARIEGNEVFVSSPEDLNPRYVRYNWVDAPSGNLFNKDGFPAAPFDAVVVPSTRRIIIAGSKGKPGELVKFDGRIFELFWSYVEQDGNSSKAYIPAGRNLHDREYLVAINDFASELDPIAALAKMEAQVKRTGNFRDAEFIRKEEISEAIFDFILEGPDRKYIEYQLFRYLKGSEGRLIELRYVVHKTAAGDQAEFLNQLPEFRKRMREEIAGDSLLLGTNAPGGAGTATPKPEK